MKRIVILLLVLLWVTSYALADDATPCQDKAVTANTAVTERQQRTPCAVILSLADGDYKLESKHLLTVTPIQGCTIWRGAGFTPRIQGNVVTAIIRARNRCSLAVSSDARAGKRWKLRLTKIGWQE